MKRIMNVILVFFISTNIFANDKFLSFKGIKIYPSSKLVIPLREIDKTFSIAYSTTDNIKEVYEYYNKIDGLFCHKNTYFKEYTCEIEPSWRYQEGGMVSISPSEDNGVDIVIVVNIRFL